MQRLMTEEIAKTVPRLYEQDGAGDPTVYAHYFSCVNGWDWWLLEFDGTDEAFGLVEGFAARFERIKAELAQIAECLSVRGFLGSFKAKLAEFAENPICKAALAAGREFMTARDGRRAEKVLVNGAREKVGEMDGLSREMGEWSLLDEVGDMRGARRELDGHEAPARPLDNQVL